MKLSALMCDIIITKCTLLIPCGNGLIGKLRGYQCITDNFLIFCFTIVLSFPRFMASGYSYGIFTLIFNVFDIFISPITCNY